MNPMCYTMVLYFLNNKTRRWGEGGDQIVIQTFYFYRSKSITFKKYLGRVTLSKKKKGGKIEQDVVSILEELPIQEKEQTSQ